MYVGAGTLLLVGMDDGEIGLPRLYEYAAPARRFPLSLGALPLGVCACGSRTARDRVACDAANPRLRLHATGPLRAVRGTVSTPMACAKYSQQVLVPSAPYGVP